MFWCEKAQGESACFNVETPGLIPDTYLYPPYLATLQGWPNGSSTNCQDPTAKSISLGIASPHYS